MATALAGLVTTPAGVAWLLTCAGEAALLLAAAWLGAALLRRAPAAARHQVWTLGVIGALLLPLLSWVAPALAPVAAPAPHAGHALAAPTVRVTAGAAPDAAPTWPAALATAWALGALVVAGRVGRGHLAARRLVRAADARVPAAWTAALREVAGARRVALRRSATIGSPMTIGVWRPRVLLPAAAEAWSPARLRAALVHELGHVGRRDTAIQLAAQAGCALYWWNPLAWLAAGRLRVEREHACDDLVLAAGIPPSRYAADLLEVARSIAAEGPALAGASGMVDRASTEARLRRILDASVSRQPLRARFRLAAHGLALAGAVTLACTSSSALPSAGSPRGTLSVGAPSVREPDNVGVPFVRESDMFRAPPAPGVIDLARVMTEVQRRTGALARCYERRLAIDPALSGTVTIHWNITETGEVAEACITEDTLGDAAVTACVNQLVQDGPFPPPRGGPVDVSFPFVFTARPAT